MLEDLVAQDEVELGQRRAAGAGSSSGAKPRPRKSARTMRFSSWSRTGLAAANLKLQASCASQFGTSLRTYMGWSHPRQVALRFTCAVHVGTGARARPSAGTCSTGE